MAKELPYFKFEPSEWEAGNIQSVSREAKGLFIEICSLYWIRLGELPYALALQKLCNGDATVMQELSNLDIIGVFEGLIIIEFLDEQLDEFQKTSEKRANAANKRWKDAKGMQVHSKSNAIREEKRREEEKREDKKGQLVFPFDSENFINQWDIWKDFKNKEFKFKYKSLQSEQAALSQLNNLANGNEETAIKIIHQSLANGYKGLFELKNNNNGRSTNEQIAQRFKDVDPNWSNY